MRILLPAAAALSACSGPPATGNAAMPQTVATPTTDVVPPPAPVASGAAVRPGELKTFGDWAVGCDNTALCQLASLAPEGVGAPGVTMAVLRQPGPAGAIDLSFDVTDDGRPVAPVAIRIDRTRLPLAALNGAPAAAVARAMANGATLTVLEAGDRPRARLSLKGASAALRWIDAQQGRAGTVTALVARGDRPATTVPERRTAPTIAAVAPGGIVADLTPARLAAMRRQASCEDDRMASSDAFTPHAHALGGGVTLVLLPCSAGAYNLSSALFVLRDGRVEPANVDAPSGFGPMPPSGEDGLASVVNGEWRDGTLISFAKGRGLGDCGVRQSFVWDGNRLRLSEQSGMAECRGNPNYIVTWRAQVVRG